MNTTTPAAPAALRPDAAAKLAGNPGYPSDRIRAGQLHGAILGSPHPHARIVAIDTRAAAAMAGVHAVVTHADIPGEARYGLRVIDRPVLCKGKVRCIGDPVAAVAAETPELAQQALAAIRVEYAPLPRVDDAEAALAEGAAAVHDEHPAGNLLHRTAHHRGDAAAAQAACVHMVEAEYESPRQMHAYLETEGGVVEPDGTGGWVVHFGCHNPERDRQVIAAMLALPPERVRVIGTPVGGSYGGKDELTIQPIAALLAWKAGRAVRLHLRRPQSVDLGVKRHPMRIRMRTGCDAEGRLRWHEVHLLADTGAYATHGPEVLDAAQEHAVGPYRYDAVAIEGRLAYTNNGIAGAFRGFGAVQVQFALERQIERLAEAVGLDAAEFRRRNLEAPDGPGPLGQVVVPFDGAAQALAAVARHPLWQGPRRWREGRWLHGVGLALVHRSDGFGRGAPNGAKLALGLAPDGAIELRASFTELGQNLVGSIGAMVVRWLGCAAADVRAVIGDSALPDAGAVAASRATTLVWRALALHGAAWGRQVCAAAEGCLGLPAGALRLGPGGLWDARATPSLRLSYADLARRLGDMRPQVQIDLAPEETPSAIDAAHYVFGACAALVQVRVDAWTGVVRVDRMVLAAALGPVVSPLGFLGQMEGGALIGQGMATIEALPMHEGRYLARNLDGYLVPTMADAPAMELITIEDLPPGDPVGPRGAGEISVNIATPAVANAIAAATGMPVARLPVAPDDLLDFLEASA
ncbi:molybdopterin cofactor-binding domain-containing protein [Aquincola sp. MAHUQ-54]|uniref:Molybdopterin cofactor-binding domain-containing protein n=1 Tax=Aquincola agrisoli TaxID=3119538 RepID=A0AAW9QD66_9BURK